MSWPLKRCTTLESVNETSRRKHTPPTMPKERNRARKKPMMPAPGLGLTLHTVLSASWSCPKTPLAPKSATTTPTAVAKMPWDGLEAFEAMSLMTPTVLWSTK